MSIERSVPGMVGRHHHLHCLRHQATLSRPPCLGHPPRERAQWNGREGWRIWLEVNAVAGLENRCHCTEHGACSAVPRYHTVHRRATNARLGWAASTTTRSGSRGWRLGTLLTRPRLGLDCVVGFICVCVCACVCWCGTFVRVHWSQPRCIQFPAPWCWWEATGDPGPSNGPTLNVTSDRGQHYHTMPPGPRHPT